MPRKVTIQTGDNAPVDITGVLDGMTFAEAELDRTKELIIELLDTHWRGILQAVKDSDDSVGSVSIGVKLDHSGQGRLVKAKLSYAVKTTDEAEYIVRDPAQKELKL